MVADIYRVRSTPTAYLIGRDHKLVGRVQGTRGSDESPTRELLDYLLKAPAQRQVHPHSGLGPGLRRHQPPPDRHRRRARGGRDAGRRAVHGEADGAGSGGGVRGVSALGEGRIRVPGSVARGSVARARALIIHPNERVERKDGKAVDRNYRFVNRVVVSYAGRDIAEFDTSTSIGENPSFGFAFRANEPGTLKVTFLDSHGGRFEGIAEVKLG